MSNSRENQEDKLQQSLRELEHCPRVEDLFEKIYTVLVRHAGAPEGLRRDFVAMTTRWSKEDPYQTREFRFMGLLGMGGKFWLTPEAFRVSAYTEDMNAARAAIINTTNKELMEWFIPPRYEDTTDGKNDEGVSN